MLAVAVARGKALGLLVKHLPEGQFTALADAIMPTRPMVTRPECAATVSERRDLHAMRAVLGPSFPSIDGPNHVVWRSTLECRRLEMLDVARSPWVHGASKQGSGSDGESPARWTVYGG